MSYTYSAGTTTPTYAGLVEFGGIRINDGCFKSEHLAGLEDGAPIRQDVVPLPGDWGGFPGAAFLSPRDIQIDGWLKQTLADDIPGAKDALRAAFALGDGSLSTLVVNQRGWATTRQLLARVTGPIVFLEPDRTSKKVPTRDFSVPMVAPDPLLYSTTQQVVTVVTGGSGTLTTLTNNGTAQTPFVVKFTGPWTNPVLVRNSDGASIGFNTSPTSSHYYQFSTNPATTTGVFAVTDLGANVYGSVVTQTALTIPPGTSSWWVGGTPSGGAACTMTFRDAWY